MNTIKTRDYTRLLAQLSEEYTRHSPASAALNKAAAKVMVDGGNHAVRLTQPFPPRITAAKGAWLTDEDNHQILDFWQGHHANILGHNPTAITSVLAQAFQDRFGLQTGFTDRLQIEVAELLCQQTGTEQVRFTTSGSLSTMYAILLARAFTGRGKVLKIGGGWHGSQPWGLKGVRFDAGGQGFEAVESQGLSPDVAEEVIVTTFNDTDMLSDRFRQHGDQLACFIMEPFIGSGGAIPATPEFVRTARALTQQYGAALIMDEVIAGFRFRAGDMTALYGVQPDLFTFGKIMGGGMPIAAVAGRADIMGLVGRAKGQRVKFSGGTYSAHPSSMLAAKTMMAYLVAHEAEVYPTIAGLGDKARRAVEDAFTQEGIYVYTTGCANEVMPGSSFIKVHFPYQAGRELMTPEEVFDPAVCDVALRDAVVKLALLVENVHAENGLGSLTAAHTDAEIAFLGEAYRRVARRIKPYL